MANTSQGKSLVILFKRIRGVLPIVSVNVSLNHTFDQDVQMYLQCPGGTTIQLSTGNGGAGANYTNTTFVPTADAWFKSASKVRGYFSKSFD